MDRNVVRALEREYFFHSKTPPLVKVYKHFVLTKPPEMHFTFIVVPNSGKNSGFFNANQSDRGCIPALLKVLEHELECELYKITFCFGDWELCVDVDIVASNACRRRDNMSRILEVSLQSRSVSCSECLKHILPRGIKATDRNWHLLYTTPEIVNWYGLM